MVMKTDTIADYIEDAAWRLMMDMGMTEKMLPDCVREVEAMVDAERSFLDEIESDPFHGQRRNTQN